MSVISSASARSCRPRSSSCSVSGSSATQPRCGADCSAHEMSEDRSEHAPEHSADPDQHGRHELPPDEPAPEIGDLHASGVKGVARRGRSQLAFGALAVLLCVLLGVAIGTQARQTESGDSLETARPADLLVLLDSLQQREAALNTEGAELQRTLPTLQG